MANFMQMKYENPKIKQSEIAYRISYTSSTLQRYRSYINMLSHYKIQPKNTNKRTKKFSNTNFGNNSHRESDLKRPQLTSNDLITPETTAKRTSDKKNKNIKKAGSVHENVDINEHYLAEILHKNDL